MTSLKATATSAAALGVFAVGTTAFADVTAEQVWEDWRGYMEASGYQVNATENRSGDTLQLTDIEMTVAIPQEDASVTMTMTEMAFTDNGDGTVSISVPPNLPVGLIVDGSDSEDAEIGINYATKGLSMIASGAPENLVYTYSAAELAMTLESLEVEGQDMNMDEFGTVQLTVANVAGSSQSSGRTLRQVNQKISSGAISYLIDINEPDGGSGRFVLRGGADGMDTNASVSLPAESDMNDMAAMLRNGFSVDGELRFSGGKMDFNFQEHGDVVQGASSSDSAGLRVVMNQDHLVYSGISNGMAVSMAGGDIPFPIELSMEEAGFNVEMPVSASDAEQDFAFGVTLGNFEMADLLWGIFDPAGQLPRDPATIAFAVTGTAKLFFDLLDPAQMEQVDAGTAMPGELNSLNINDLTVKAVGAELTGGGSFTFDNSDLTTFDGVPAPTGELNLMLVGGNALLDTLVNMGLVPAEEASGMRMMMGLFAVAGSTPDTLTSKIEIKGNGQILANGQRIQ